MSEENLKKGECTEEGNIEKAPEKFRISVANLVHGVRIQGTDDIFYIGIMHHKLLEDDVPKFQALGGGAKLTTEGKVALEDMGAEFAQKDDADAVRAEENDDARFIIPAEKLQEALDFFVSENKEDTDEEGSASQVEHAVLREVREELTRDIELSDGSVITSVLTPEEAATIEESYVTSVCQVPPPSVEGDTSHRKASVPTRRFFNLFELSMTQEVFDKLRASKAIHVFSEEDFRKVMDAGSPKAIVELGEEGNTTRAQVADNLMPEVTPASMPEKQEE